MTMEQRRHLAIGTNFMFVSLLYFVLASNGQSNDDGFPSPADLPAQPGLPDPLVMLDGRKSRGDRI